MPTVLITGAGRGFGFELARQYAADGWRVLACCRDVVHASALKSLADETDGAIEPIMLETVTIFFWLPADQNGRSLYQTD